MMYVIREYGNTLYVGMPRAKKMAKNIHRAGKVAKVLAFASFGGEA